MTNLMRASHLSRLAQERKKDRLLTVHDLYPAMSAAWYAEAEVTLGRILSHTLAMYERLRHEPGTSAMIQALTDAQRCAEMKSKRSTPCNGESSPHDP